MHRRVRFQGQGHLGPLPGSHGSSHPATAAVRSAALGATGGAVAARGGGVQRTHTAHQVDEGRLERVAGAEPLEKPVALLVGQMLLALVGGIARRILVKTSW